MKKYKWHRFVWADGTESICRGYSRQEMAVEVRKHGKLIAKIYEGTF